VVITPPSRPLLARTRVYQVPVAGEGRSTETLDVHDGTAADALDPARVRSAVDPDLPDDAGAQAEPHADPAGGRQAPVASVRASRKLKRR
jgi:hypothetical protein